MKKSIKSYFKVGTEVYEEIDHGLYTTGKTVNLALRSAPFTWNGGKIELNLWREILSFFTAGYEKTQSENLVYLYYNPVSHDWIAWAPPQICAGMTVKANQDAVYDKQRKQIPSEYVQLGTIHHHCTGAAFASGTDTKDEEDRDGLHITVGGISLDKPLTLHCRATFRKESYDTNILEWIKQPEWLEQVPESIRTNLVLAILTNQHETTEFPEIWLTNCEKPVYQQGFRNSNWKWQDWEHQQANSHQQMMELGDAAKKKSPKLSRNRGRCSRRSKIPSGKRS